MDLSTVSHRIDRNYYSSFEAFHRDMLAIFWNGCSFNPFHDIWYQQCVVLKVCYMNIVKQLEESGILDAIEAASRVESNQIVAAESRNGEVVCFSSSSTPSCRIVAKNSESFKRNYFEIQNVQPLVNYPVRFVKRDFERSRNERRCEV